MSQQTTSPAPLIDIGANLTHECFISDIPAVVSRAKAAGLVQIMVTGASLQGSQQAAQLAQQHSGFLWASAGIHPHHADEADAGAMTVITQLLNQPEVKAVGETGLDFFRDLCPRAQQVKAFEAHIELAIDLQMPMFLHERDASETFIEVLSAYRDRLSKVVVHCFTGEAAALHSYLDMDCHIGITGWLCDERRGTHLIPLMADIPDDRLMIETDAPYLMPRNIRPKPNNRHNQPHFLSYVCQAVADARGTDYASVAAATTANAIAFYAL